MCFRGRHLTSPSCTFSHLKTRLIIFIYFIALLGNQIRYSWKELSTVLSAISLTLRIWQCSQSSHIKGIKPPKSTPAPELEHLVQVSGKSARSRKVRLGRLGGKPWRTIDANEEQPVGWGC